MVSGRDPRFTRRACPRPVKRCIVHGSFLSGGIKIEARWFIKETVRGADGQIVKGDDGKPKKEGPFLDAKGISRI